MNKEAKMINHAVKKVLLPLESAKGFNIVGTDKGTIDE